MKTNILNQDLTISTRFVRCVNMWNSTKAHFYVTLSSGDKKVNFSFYQNENKMNDENKIFALYCFVSDSLSYDEYSNVDDFATAFGYDKVSELLKAFEGCKKSSEKAHYFFNANLYDIANYLTENYNI